MEVILRKRNAKKLEANEKLKSGIFVFWNPESAQVESVIQQLESGFHSMESRI